MNKFLLRFVVTMNSRSILLLLPTFLESDVRSPRISRCKVTNFALNTKWYLDPYAFTKKSMNPFRHILVHLKTDFTACKSGLSVRVTKVFFIVVHHTTVQPLTQQTGCIEAMGAPRRFISRNTFCWHGAKRVTVHKQ